MEKYPDSLLIIFVRNPVRGKVKTRLAATIGDDKAFDTYLKLLKYTRSVTENVRASKAVFYADVPDLSDQWQNDAYLKFAQRGNDLGERMENAFNDGFDKGFRKLVIIGSDCPELTPGIVNTAFHMLDQYDIVIGPSSDGGYYLLGMMTLHPSLFAGIEWSTDKVFSQTNSRISAMGLSLYQLPILDDLDNSDDYLKFKDRLDTL